MSYKEERRRGEKEGRRFGLKGEIRRREGQENKLASTRANYFAWKYFKKIEIKSQEIKMLKKV